MIRSLFAFIFLFFFSCGNEKPEGVIELNTMKLVWWDLLQADGMAEHYQASDTSFPVLQKRLGYYQSVYEIHGVKPEAFEKTMKYYQENPELLKVLLDSVQQYADRSQLADTLPKRLEP